MEEEFKNQEFANDANCTCENEKHTKCHCRCFSTVLNIILVIAVVVLYILHFCNINNATTNNKVLATTNGTSNLKITGKEAAEIAAAKSLIPSTILAIACG